MQDEERTVIISSHGLSDLERFADNVGMIKSGRLLLEGPTGELMERFKSVDFVTESGSAFTPPEGLFVQKHEDNRWQTLVDTQKASLEFLTERGARQVTTAPVTLEDVFVALAGESRL